MAYGQRIEEFVTWRNLQALRAATGGNGKTAARARTAAGKATAAGGVRAGAGRVRRAAPRRRETAH